MSWDEWNVAATSTSFYPRGHAKHAGRLQINLAKVADTSQCLSRYDFWRCRVLEPRMAWAPTVTMDGNGRTNTKTRRLQSIDIGDQIKEGA